jgi:PRTRC genetic system protein B
MSIFTINDFAAVPSVRAVQAVIVHEAREGTEGNAEYVLTTHTVENTDKGVTLGAGRFVSAADMAALTEVLISAQPAQHAYLPQEIVSCSATQLAWYTEARIRPMWFRAGNDRRKVTVPWPTLLFRARPGELAVAALARSGRPKPDQPLFHAPLMNIHQDTGLCPGSARLPPACSLEHRDGYEFCIFGTAFTHVNHERTLKLAGENSVNSAEHLRFWRQLERRRIKRFPTSALVPLKRRVAQWLAEP